MVNDNGTSRKPRPILIKLRVAWDKRIILNKSSKLKQYSQHGIFISSDEPLETRRKNTLERLKYRAVRAGQRVAVNDGVLIVDDVAVFSLQNGNLRNTDG